MFNTQHFFPLLLSVFLMAGCMTYKDVEFNGVSNFKVDDVQKDHISVSFDASVYNPNNYKIKVKSNDLDVLLGDKKIGTARLRNKVVLKKQVSDDYRVEVTADLKKTAGGGLSSIISVMSGGALSIRVRGFIKARARGLGKKIEIDETRSFNPSDLKLPF